jgi:hypothetical protein
VPLPILAVTWDGLGWIPMKNIQWCPYKTFDAKNPLLSTLKSGNLTEKVIISEPCEVTIVYLWAEKLF